MTTPTEVTRAAVEPTEPAVNALGLRMVGASGAVCVDGVCSIDVAPPSLEGTASPEDTVGQS